MNEPPHVHIGKDGDEAKFWIKPVEIARAGRFKQFQLNEIEQIISDNLDFLLDVWEKEKSKHVNG